jgi:adenylate cyclase
MLEQRAISLDGSLPSPHLLLSLVQLRQGEYDAALSEAQQAIALDPNFADGYGHLGEVLGRTGRSREAVEAAKKAIRLSPQDVGTAPYFNTLGWNCFLTGQYEEAIDALKKAIAHNPNSLYAHINLAGVYGELGRQDEARAEAAEVLRLNPNFSLEVWRQTAPFKDPAVAERFLAARRKAGLK